MAHCPGGSFAVRFADAIFRGARAPLYGLRSAGFFSARRVIPVTKWFGLRARLSMSGFAVAVAAARVAVPAAAVTGAGFTTVNEGVDGTGHCQNGNPAINCNIYDGKDFVWLNGGPDVAYVGDGTYFFAVLAPGGQHDPLDGSANNLSDTTAAPWSGGETNSDGSTVPSGDTYKNRTFTVSTDSNGNRVVI